MIVINTESHVPLSSSIERIPIRLVCHHLQSPVNLPMAVRLAAQGAAALIVEFAAADKKKTRPTSAVVQIAGAVHSSRIAGKQLDLLRSPE